MFNGRGMNRGKPPQKLVKVGKKRGCTNGRKILIV